MRRLIVAIICAVSLLGAYMVGRYSVHIPVQKPASQMQEVRLPQEYHFINPLLECDNSIGDFQFPNQIKEKVQAYIDAQIGAHAITTAGVYYRDLNNGPWFGINDHTLFTPASLIKVPLMMMYYKKAELDPEILKKKLLLPVGTSEVIGEVFTKPEKSLEEGQKYTVEELIEHMIMYSDNSAYVVLKEDMRQGEFSQFFADFRIDVSSFGKSGSDDVLSIKDYSSFFRILFNSSYLDRTYSEKALSLLAKTTYPKGITAGVPTGTTVSHKFGERYSGKQSEKQLHDCGIVYRTDRPYLICIMTRGNDFGRLEQTIGRISELVYQSL